MSHIVFEEVGKHYKGADSATIEGLNLTIKKGEFVAFVGPSGCGKTTTLRMLAGLEEISEGTIFVNQEVINDTQPRDRNVAMVFQNYALYPHKTVYDNIAFGLKMKKMDKKVIKEKVDWAADILGISDQLLKKPKELSGGQRQRVALARAIVKENDIFLMDEPLSNLDAKLRVSTRKEIINLHRFLKSTFVYVTHDQTEAMTMATMIVVMNNGKIMQVGTPKKLYQEPANLFVATFIGTPQMNILRASIDEGYFVFSFDKKIKIPQNLLDKVSGLEHVDLGIRSEDVCTKKLELETYSEQKIDVDVDFVELVGKHFSMYSAIAEKEIIVDTDQEHEIGENISIAFKPHKIHLFHPETGERL